MGLDAISKGPTPSPRNKNITYLRGLQVHK